MTLTGNVTDHFSWREIASPGNPPDPVPEQYHHNARNVCLELEKIRRLCGAKPLTVTSVYRTPAYNDALRQQGYPAAEHSQHLYANAADILPPFADMTTTDLATLVQILAQQPDSRIRYIKRYDTHVHFDLRPLAAVVTEGF